MKSRQEEVEELKKLITAFEKLYRDGDLSHQVIDRFQVKLDKLADSQRYTDLIGDSRYLLYELQALLELAKGNFERANTFIADSQSMMGADDYFMSDVISSYILSNTKIAATTAIEPVKNRKFNGKLDGWLAFYGLRILVVPFVFGYDAISSTGANAPNDFTNLLHVIVLADVILATAALFMWFEFFKKKRAMINHARIFEACLALYYFITSAWLASLINQYSIASSDLTSKYAGYGIIAVLWLIYWFRSKRVRETFEG